MRRIGRCSMTCVLEDLRDPLHRSIKKNSPSGMPHPLRVRREGPSARHIQGECGGIRSHWGRVRRSSRCPCRTGAECDVFGRHDVAPVPSAAFFSLSMSHLCRVRRYSVAPVPSAAFSGGTMSHWGRVRRFRAARCRTCGECGVLLAVHVALGTSATFSGDTMSHSGRVRRATPRTALLAYSSSTLRTARNASWGTSTVPTCFMRFLPSFCFSRSLRLRVMSPP